jgi:outer membrane protein assembly factor BamB/tetratricopeptide (TPR) repeat protein
MNAALLRSFRCLLPLAFVGVVCLLATTAGAADQAAETTDTARISKLLDELGSDVFATREQAERSLVETGLTAVELLRDRLGTGDPEVRRRAGRALRDILEADLQQRIKTFESDPTDEGDGIPGWSRFREKNGSSEIERDLFVQMLKAEPGLLLSSELGQESTVDALKFRVRRFMQTQNTPDPSRRALPPIGTTLAFLFISSDEELLGRTAPMEVSWIRNWLRQSSFRKFVDDKEKGVAAKKLVTSWVMARTSNGSFHIDRLYDAVTFKLKAALPVAVQGLKTKPYQGMAIDAIARLGGKEYAALLLPVLDDKTVIATFTTNKKRVEVQARDVALAWLVHLTGQDVKAYGFSHAKQWFDSRKKNNRSGFSAGAYRIDDLSKRDTYRKTWDEWLAKNPLPKPPKDFAEVAALGPATVQKIEKEPDPDEEEEWEEPEPYIGPRLADRFDLQKLRRAREAIANEQWFDAARGLAELAGMPYEKWFQPERGKPNFRELRSEVERLILTLPDAGLAEVEKLSGAVAQKRLEEALEQSDLQAVEAVSQSFFFTRAGASATWRLATMALDAGQPFDALLQFERLAVASRYAESYEPQLSLRTALCHARLQQLEQAERVVRDLHQRYPQVNLSPGSGDPLQFDEPAESLAWLTAITGHTERGPAGWLMHRGNALRNSVSEPLIPDPDAEPLATLAESKPLQAVVEFVSNQKSLRRLGRIPSVQPLVVGDRVIFRTATGLHAIDKEGTPLWTAPQQDALWELTRMGREWTLPEESPAAATTRNGTTTKTPEEQLGSDIVDGVQERLLDSTLYGTLSSDGERVFAVESDDFRSPPFVQRFTVTDEGQLQLETRTLSKQNSLVAYDVQTGRLLWEQNWADSTSDSAEDTSATPTEFLGVPLVAGSRLFVVVRVEDEVRLRQLDPATGESTREWMLQSDAPPPRRVFWTQQYPAAPGQRHACSPSFADGTIISLTPSNRVVAIDLRTGRLQWSWLGTRRRKAPVRWRFNPWLQIAANAQRNAELDHWCDVSLVLADGCVLVATPDSNELTCLDQKDGAVRWSVQRRDGLYVAGVHDGRVIVIGRGGVRAFHLQDGSLAWPAGEIVWPDAAMPSGSGYLSDDRYCVPLTSGEVVVIDLKSGQWVARSHSRKHVIPGNLVAMQGTVWSLGLDGLRRFASTETRSEELAARLASQPDDAVRLTDWAESLLNGGRVAEALVALRQAVDTDQKDRAEQLLARAVRDGVPFDRADRSRLVDELDLSNGTLEQRVSLHAETALGFERQGDIGDALQSLMKIVDLPITQKNLSGEKTLIREESVSRSVRIDRWFQSKSRDWYAAVDGQVRKDIDQRVADFVRTNLRHSMTWFGQHSTAEATRLRLAEQLRKDDSDGDNQLLWELLLRQTIAANSRASADAALEQLEQGLSTIAPRRAAHIQRHARGDGMIARVSGSPWPDGTVQYSAEKRDPKSPYVQRVQFPVERYDGRLDEPLWLQLNVSQRKWSVLDASGRTRYTLQPVKNEKPTSYSYSTNVTQARLIGPVLVVWSGMQVAAYRLQKDEGKYLWSRQLYDPQNQPWVMRFVPRRVRRAGRRAAVVFGNTGPSAWRAVVANPGYVVLQHDQQLLALELNTGEVLWKHDGIPYDCDITGDEDIVAVIPPDLDEAITFSALDGRELTRRPLTDGDDWVVLRGRLLVTWRARQQQAVMRCVDLQSGEEKWSRPFAVGTHYHSYRPDQISVLEPNGRFSVLDVASGQARTSAQLGPVKDLQGLTVFESRGLYIVCARTPDAPAANGVIIRVNMSGNYPGRLRVGGKLFAVNTRDGSVDWTAELPSQAVAPPVLSDVPLMASYYTLQKQKKQPNGAISTTHEYWLQVMNLNNGIIAHKVRLTSGPQIDQQYFPEEACVKLHTRSNVTQFRFAVGE